MGLCFLNLADNKKTAVACAAAVFLSEKEKLLVSGYALASQPPWGEIPKVKIKRTEHWQHGVGM